MAKVQGKDIVSAGLSAAGTAVAPVVGTAIGGLVGNAIGNLFGGGKGDTSGQPGPALRELVRQLGAGAFADYLKARQPEALGWTREQLLPLFYVWLFDTGKTVGWWTTGGNIDSGPGYVPGLTERAYAAMGIDYARSRDNWKSGKPFPVEGGKWTGWVMLPSGGTPQAPAVAAAAGADLLDKLRSGAPLTDAERLLLQQLKDGTPQASKGTNPLTVVILLLLAYAILKG
jgi:hypothetical protein